MKTNVIDELISQVNGPIAYGSPAGAIVSPCDLAWFEMLDVIDRTYGETEWTPLWRYESIENGDRHAVGYTEDHLRIRTLFAPLSNKRRLILGTWLDFDPDTVYPCVDNGIYCKPFAYYFDSSEGDEAGEYPVFGFDSHSGMSVELRLNQDLETALRLVRVGDEWIRPEEGNVPVVRLVRDENKRVFLIEIRTEHLKDYLFARNMGLYMEEFRERRQHVLDDSFITWKCCHGDERRYCSHGKYEWKGWLFRHDDADRWEESEERKGPLVVPTYYRVEGQLWKQYWIDPGLESPRIVGTQENCEFFVSPNGRKHSVDALDDNAYGAIYLFFDPMVVRHLQECPTVKMTWVSRDVFDVEFPGHSAFHCGVSKKGHVFVIAADIARLEQWAQRLWQRENVKPEDKMEYVDHELFQNQMCCEFLKEQDSPEVRFQKVLSEFGDVFNARFGFEIWTDAPHEFNVLEFVTRFESINKRGLADLGKFIYEATAERFSERRLKKFIADRIDIESHRSIMLLADAINLLDAKLDGNALTKFLKNINALRIVSSHRMSKEDAAKSAGVCGLNVSDSFVEQGAQLIEYAVTGFEKLVQALSSHNTKELT